MGMFNGEGCAGVERAEMADSAAKGDWSGATFPHMGGVIGVMLLSSGAGVEGGIVNGASVTPCFATADIAMAIELVGAEGVQVV